MKCLQPTSNKIKNGKSKNSKSRAALLVALCWPIAPWAGEAGVRQCCSDDPSVYQAFGEREGIQRVMKVFMRKLMADSRTQPFFEDSDRAKLVEHLTDQFCYVMNGPCEYKGRSMVEAHQGQHIHRQHFNALVEDLQAAMDEQQVPTRAQHKVLAVLAPLYRQIEEP